jgi:hypothetical protein
MTNENNIDTTMNDLKVKKFRKDTKKLLKIFSKIQTYKLKIDFNSFTANFILDDEENKITLNDSLDWVYSLNNIKLTQFKLSEAIIDISKVETSVLKWELEQLIHEKDIETNAEEIEEICFDIEEVQKDIENLNNLQLKIKGI